MGKDVAEAADRAAEAVGDIKVGDIKVGDVKVGDVKVVGAKGRRVQVRKVRATGWTKAKRARFLDRLAVTCNVRASALAAGIASANAYALKRRDPEFASLWTAALEAGYEHIEAQLLARAIGHNPAGLGESPDADAFADASADGFDPALAMKVMGLRDTRRTASVRGPVGKRVPIEQVRAILAVKLTALRRHLEARQAIAEGTGHAAHGDPAGGSGAA